MRRVLLKWFCLILLSAFLYYAEGAPSATTWYFSGAVTSVEDTYTNSTDDAAFAAGVYSLGHRISGSITIDPSADPTDYDDPSNVNFGGADDPDLGYYSGVATNFDFQLLHRVEENGIHNYSSSITNTDLNGQTWGGIELINDLNFGSNITGDFIRVYFPSQHDEYDWNEGSPIYHDRNGWHPAEKNTEIDRTYLNLYLSQTLWNAHPDLLADDELVPVLPVLGANSVVATLEQIFLAGSSPVSHQIVVTYTLDRLSLTPPPGPTLTITSDAGPGSKLGINYSGYIYQSLDLNSWSLMNPQPTNSFDLPIGPEDKKFFMVVP